MQFQLSILLAPLFPSQAAMSAFPEVGGWEAWERVVRAAAVDRGALEWLSEAFMHGVSSPARKRLQF